MTRKILIILAMILLLFISGCLSADPVDIGELTMHLYNDGKTEIYSNDAEVKLQSILTDAQDYLSLIITENKVNELRETAALEVVYIDPIEITIAKINQSIEIDRIIIDLSSESDITSIYCGLSEYSYAFSVSGLNDLKNVLNF